MLSNETHSHYSTHTTSFSVSSGDSLTSASEHLSTASCRLSTLHSTYTQVILSESSCWLGCRSKDIVLLRITRPVLISEKNNVILSLHFYGFFTFLQIPDDMMYGIWASCLPPSTTKKLLLLQKLKAALAFMSKVSFTSCFPIYKFPFSTHNCGSSPSLLHHDQYTGTDKEFPQEGGAEP